MKSNRKESKIGKGKEELTHRNNGQSAGSKRESGFIAPARHTRPQGVQNQELTEKRGGNWTQEKITTVCASMWWAEKAFYRSKRGRKRRIGENPFSGIIYIMAHWTFQKIY